MATARTRLKGNAARQAGLVSLEDVLFSIMEDEEATRGPKTIGKGYPEYQDDQPRDEHGRWSGGGGGERNIAKNLLLRNEAKQGGRISPEEFKKNYLNDEQRAFIASAEARLAKSSRTEDYVEDGGFKQRNGRWTPERQRLHEQIVRDYIEKGLENAVPEEGEAPTAILLGGRGGSGKTTATKDLIDTSNFINLNSDDIKAMLPGFEGWNAGLFHEESSFISDQIERAARELGLNILYDATLKSETSATDRVSKYEAAGYNIEGVFVHTTPVTSAERAMDRMMHTGRYVPPEYILESRSNEATFDAIKNRMSKWTLIDNNGDFNPKVIARGGK
jgi:predicted ABC-type ATPase